MLQDEEEHSLVSMEEEKPRNGCELMNIIGFQRLRLKTVLAFQVITVNFDVTGAAVNSVVCVCVCVCVALYTYWVFRHL